MDCHVSLAHCGSDHGLWIVKKTERFADQFKIKIDIGSPVVEWCTNWLGYVAELALRDDVPMLIFKTPEDAMLFRLQFGAVLNDGD